MNEKQDGRGKKAAIDDGKAASTSRHERIELLKRKKQMLQEKLEQQSASKNYRATYGVSPGTSCATSSSSDSNVGFVTDDLTIKVTSVNSIVNIAAIQSVAVQSEDVRKSMNGDVGMSSSQQKTAPVVVGVRTLGIRNVSPHTNPTRTSVLPLSHTSTCNGSIASTQKRPVMSPSSLSIPKLLQTANQLGLPSTKPREELRPPAFDIPVSSIGKYVLPTTTTPVSTVSVAQLVYGQIGVLPGSTQPVFFIQSPTASNVIAPSSNMITAVSQSAQITTNVQANTILTPGPNSKTVVTPGPNSKTIITPGPNSKTIVTPGPNSKTIVTPGPNSKTIVTPGPNSKTIVTPGPNSKTVVTPVPNSAQTVHLIPFTYVASSTVNTPTIISNTGRQQTALSYVLNVCNTNSKISLPNVPGKPKVPVVITANATKVPSPSNTRVSTIVCTSNCSTVVNSSMMQASSNVNSNIYGGKTSLSSLKIAPMNSPIVIPLNSPLLNQSSQPTVTVQGVSTPSAITFKNSNIERRTPSQIPKVPAALDPLLTTSMTIQGGEIIRITKPQQKNPAPVASSTNTKLVKIAQVSPSKHHASNFPSLAASKVVAIKPNVLVRISAASERTEASAPETVTAPDKALVPINNSGSARTNGIKPYRRVDTIIYEDENKITTVSNSSQLPMISGYKSLAGECRLERSRGVISHVKVNDTISECHVVSTVSSEIKINTISTAFPKASTPGSATPVISGVFSMSAEKNPKLSVSKKVDVIDLTSEACTKEDILNEKRAEASVPRDTVGIVRTDTKEFVLMRDGNTELRQDYLKNDVVKISSSLLMRSNGSSSIKAITPKDYLKDDRVKIRSSLLMKNSNLSSATPTTPITQLQTAKKRKRKKKLVKDSSGNVNYDASENVSNRFLKAKYPVYNYSEAPTSVEKISRTFFALDRLYRTRKYFESVEALEKCIDSLQALRNALVVEKSKQQTFMDDILTKWKQKALHVKSEQKVKLTPAQKLLEKFSLDKYISKPLKEGDLGTSKDALKMKNEAFDARKSPVTAQAYVSSSSQLPSGSVSRREKRKTFSEILEEQRKRKELKKQLTNQEVSVTQPMRIDAKKGPSANAYTEKKMKIKKHVNTEKKVQKKNISATSVQKSKKTSKPLPKQSLTVETTLATSRTRPLSRKSNPKDPFNSAEDRMLQQALALSLKTANEERRRYQGTNQTLEHLPSKRRSVENLSSKRRSAERFPFKRKSAEGAITDSSRKKKRPTEVDQLVDTHWNESWLKDSPSTTGPTEVLSPTSSIREERALHYAMAKFAEMEHEKERVKSPPIERDLCNTVQINKKVKDTKVSTKSKVKVLKASTGSGKVTKTKSKLSSKKKKLDLVKKAKLYRNKAKAKSVLPTPNVVIEKFTEDQILSYKKTNIKKQTPTQQQSGLIQKKEYILVPKYHGFKDFTPIVVDSRTRRQASSEDRSKLKKAEFPLMVVEKVGNQTKEVIVKEGENKEQKLAEASNALQKQFESLSKKKRYLTCSRSAGETVLHKAARLGYDDLAELSIQQGADVHARDNAGWSALHEACAYGKIDVVRVLLKYGADPNCFSNSGVRPLHDAVEKKDLRVIRLLLSYGADLNISSYTGALPSDIARVPAVKKFLEDVKKDQSLIRDENDENEHPWLFQGSCEKLDSNDCSGIFDKLPKQDATPYFDFLMNNRSMPRSFYLPYKSEDGVILGHRNYFIFSDILERLNLSRKAFLKHHKVELQTLPWSEFAEYVRHSTISHLPEQPGCSSGKMDDVELVHVGHYTLKKMFAMRGYRIGL